MSIKNIKGYAWIVIGLSSFLLFYKYIALVFPSLIAGDIKLHFGINSAQMGFLSAVFLYCVLCVQPFAGLLLDRFGCRNVSTVSLLVSAFGILLFAASNHIAFAFIGRLMMGLGVAFATVSYMKAAATWFDEKGFSVASSLLLTAAMAGAVVGQAPLSALFNSVGWQEGLYYCAIIGVVFAIIYWFIVRDDPKEGHANIAEEQASLHEQKSILKMVKRVISSRNNWLLMAYSGLIFTTIDAFGGLWGNSFFVQKYALTTTQASYFISCIFIGMGVGAPIMGKLSVKIRCVPIMFCCTIIGCLSLLAILYLHLTIGLLVVCCLVYGIVTSSFMLVFVVGRKVNPLWVMATAVALINTGEPIFGGTFEGLVGMILDYLQPEVLGANYSVTSYEIAFGILPGSIILALITLCFVREKQRL